MRLLMTLPVAACALALAVQSASAAVSFDPIGGGNATITFTAVDMAPGNVLLTNVTPNAGGDPTAFSFDLYYQARVQALEGANGTPVYIPGGSNPQLTVVGHFTGLGHLVSLATAELTLVGGLHDAIGVYAGTTPDDLAGTGFFDPAKEILFATAYQGFGSYTNGSGTVPLDSFGANNLPGVTTTYATGSALFWSTPSVIDSGYFPDPTQLTNILASTNLSTPFIAVNPSALFTDPYSGATITVGANDLRMQADGNLTFLPVPEPASLGLLGLGAVALLRRKR